MIFHREMRWYFPARKRFIFWVIGAALLVASCGHKSDVETTIPESAVMPRKGITVNTTGESLLTDAQQETLLAIARRSIAYYLRTGSNPPDPTVSDTALLKNRGCLIKLIVDGKTRGTSGYLLPVKRLAAAVAELAMRAATGGGRFDALKPQELARTIIQITVVSEPVTISKDAEVIIKRHGLVLMYQERVAGVLLTDDVIQSGSSGVAIDRLLSFNRMTRNDWKSPGVKIQTFTVQVFQEKSSS